MSSLNAVHLIGRVGQNPNSRTTAGGTEVCSLSLATSEKLKRNGKTEEITTWHDVIFYGKLAGVCSQFVTKGSLLYVNGRINKRKWQDKDGNDRYTTEIIGDKLVMLGGGSKGDGPRKEAPVGSVADDDDMDIPF